LNYKLAASRFLENGMHPLFIPLQRKRKEMNTIMLATQHTGHLTTVIAKIKKKV
jgi:hypothetical protein